VELAAPFAGGDALFEGVVGSVSIRCWLASFSLSLSTSDVRGKSACTKGSRQVARVKWCLLSEVERVVESRNGCVWLSADEVQVRRSCGSGVTSSRGSSF
jgi:hypothetical protein